MRSDEAGGKFETQVLTRATLAAVGLSMTSPQVLRIGHSRTMPSRSTDSIRSGSRQPVTTADSRQVRIGGRKKDSALSTDQRLQRVCMHITQGNLPAEQPLRLHDEWKYHGGLADRPKLKT